MSHSFLAATAPIFDFLPMPFNFIVLLMVIIFSWLLIQSVVDAIARFARERQLIDFKRELIDRGMDADEVKTVLEAAPLESEDD